MNRDPSVYSSIAFLRLRKIANALDCTDSDKQLMMGSDEAGYFVLEVFPLAAVVYSPLCGVFRGWVLLVVQRRYVCSEFSLLGRVLVA